jgi:heme a synthase
VVAEIGVAIGGSVVRVTGSGLGCPTWPECYPGSMVPTARSDVATLHQWIEFGNRLLGVAVVLVAGIVFLAALNTRPRRRRLLWLAAAQPLGVVAQAVVGGFTVLTGLVWWSVATHFLVSIVLVWLSVQLVDAATGGDGPPRRLVPRPVRGLIATSTVVLAALLVAGTLVTAAGPHAGDAATPRLDLGVPQLAQLHADLLFAYLGLLVGVGFALRTVAAPSRLWRRYLVLGVVVLAQGALGGLQYALGVPETLVSFHVLGAALVTVAAAAVWVATVERPLVVPAPEPAPGPSPRQTLDAART